jgi:DNA-binding CsgD family transcriptional regulator
MVEDIQFSRREQEVIKLLVQGKSNKQIALVLGVSLRTVEFHLSHIYAKLGVASRTEAALKLAATNIRESAGGELREPTVPEKKEPGDNGETAISARRTSMKNILYTMGGLLLATLLLALAIFKMPGRGENVALTRPTPNLAATVSLPTEAAAPVTSPRERILEQIRKLAAEYDQSVQAAKQNGNVETGKDPATGQDTFRFTGETYMRVSTLFDEFLMQKTELEGLYTKMYRDEIRPTPFPTQPSDEQNRLAYETLMGQSSKYCSLESWQQDRQAESLSLYDPEEGIYKPIFMGEVIARCEVYGQMLEELRTARTLQEVDQDADIELIRQIMGRPELTLTFETIRGIANAPWQNAAVYIDETGTKYYVDIGTARLSTIEPNFPSHPDIAPNKAKSMDELRGIARQFATTNSPRLAELENGLLHEESCKISLCFFTWSARDKDWTGTDWAMMPPFLQVGVLTDGQIATYINTLDLFEPAR